MSRWKVATLSALALITAFGCSGDDDLFAGMWNFNYRVNLDQQQWSND